MGTQKEKLPRGPSWVQWSPCTGGAVTSICLFCGVGGSRPEVSWLLMATGALPPSQGRLYRLWKVSFLSLLVPSARALWCLSRLCRALEWGHPGSRIPLTKLSLHPWPFVLMESGRFPPPPHLASYVVETAVVRQGARCSPLCGCASLSPAFRMGSKGGGSPSKAQSWNYKVVIG